MQAALAMFHRLLGKFGGEAPEPGRERRRSKRYRVEIPVQFRILLRSCPGVSTTFMQAQLRDISEHGAGLMLKTTQYDGLSISRINSETSDGYVFEIVIPFGDFPIQVCGKMVWNMHTPDQGPFVLRLGLVFVDVGLETKGRLRSFVQICEHAGEIHDR